MITTLLSDFSYVLLFPKDKGYVGKLNDLYRKLTAQSLPVDISEYYVVNEKLLGIYKTWKSRSPNRKVVMFTEGAMHTDPYLRKILDTVFDACISTADMGFHKSEPEAFQNILQKLQIEPNTTAFFDDNPGNVTAATSTGIHAFQYITNEQTEKDLRALDES